MKVLILCRYHRDGSSSRVRFMQYIPYLESEGVDITVSPLLYKDYIKTIYSGRRPSLIRIAFSYLSRMLVLTNIRKYDILWIEKELFPKIPAWFERFILLAKKKYIVDYDDATFLNYRKSFIPNKIAKIMGMSSCVVCGNEFLLDYARNAGAKKVKLLPTIVNLDHYTIKKKNSKNVIIIGWIGAPYTVHYLLPILDILVTMSESVPLVLHVVGATIEHPNVNIKCIPWCEKNESTLIQEFDIGIMPLSDSPWEEGKCAYKLIQYMACGLPVIGSNIGANKEVIAHGENGFLAKTSDDWLKYLNILVDNLERRELMGAAGRSVVENKYCTKVLAPVLKEVLTNKGCEL
jgi:glycosyltransferase involved in cell wall biosynthesis